VRRGEKRKGGKGSGFFPCLGIWGDGINPLGGERGGLTLLKTDLSPKEKRYTKNNLWTELEMNDKGGSHKNEGDLSVS